MTRLTFATAINAPRDVVWRTMLEDETYRQWTSAFQEGSYAVTDWKPGSKALFLAPDGSGMVSRIAEHRPNDYLSLEHIGVVKNGVEDTTSTEVLKWAGARENYTVREHAGQVVLTIDMDTAEEQKPMFEDIWPKALAALKDLSERAARVAMGGAEGAREH
ncbi:MAG: SRPBCC domain-containing protein [Vicinamibacterales bacterium]